MTNLFLAPPQVVQSAGFRLRPYQEEAIRKVAALYRQGVNRTLLVAATGLGKTVIFAHLPEFFPELSKHGMLVVVHRKELVEQAADKIRQAWPDLRVDIEMAEHRAHRSADVVVASVQTLGRTDSHRIRKFRGRFGIVVVDEAHHVAPGSQYERVLDFFGVGPDLHETLITGQKRLLLGVTATPNRHDGQGLHAFFDDIADNLDIRWGVKGGYLVDIHATRIQTGTDISDVGTRAGDFALNELENAVSTHERNEVIVKAFVETGARKAIAFCVGVRHAHELAAEFRSYGIPARAIDGGMEREEREEIVEDFRKGRFQVLTNCQVATEGFDVPDVDTVLMARPTKSTPLYTQMIGRGTRPVINPTQESAEERVRAIRASSKPFMRIIDFTDNTGKHPVVTAPKLFGLERDFETKGKSIIQAVETIEALESASPDKPLRKARSLDEVEIIARQISVWDVAETPESLTPITGYHWMEVSEGVFQIHVPAGMISDGPYAQGSCTPEERRDFAVRLEPDRLGRYRATVTKPPVFEDGVMVRPKEVVTSDKIHDSKEEAIQAVDAFLQSRYAGVSHLISRGMAWQEKPASEAQVSFLRRLKVYIPDGYALTKGQASRLINAAKARRM